MEMCENQRNDLLFLHGWGLLDLLPVATALSVTTTIMPTRLVCACFASGGMLCLSSAYFTPNVTKRPLCHSCSFLCCLHFLLSSLRKRFLNPPTLQHSVSPRITTRQTTSHGQQTSECLSSLMSDFIYLFIYLFIFFPG